MKLFLVILFCKTSFSVFVSEKCKHGCEGAKLSSLEGDNNAQEICQSGCTYFDINKNIIGTDLDPNMFLNWSLRECYSGHCEESYTIDEEQDVCKKGCDLYANPESMWARLPVFDTDSILEMPDSLDEEDQDLSNFLAADTEISRKTETDKIPDKGIKTVLPIEFAEEEITVKESKDWLDCASYNSGIPRWFLLTSILTAALIAVWICFSTEKKRKDEPTVLLDAADDKIILIDDANEKDPKLLEANEVNFLAPPKYTTECEQV